tara:strand:+ start:8052 stop:8984 length:933 start_codon:yes stop_codon:yes gene_type:complete
MDISFRLPKYSGGEVFITLAEAKDHLRIEQTNEDLEIQGFIDGAISQIEGYLGGAILQRPAVVFALPCFPDRLQFPTGPIEGITGIKYLESGSTRYKTLSNGTAATASLSLDGNLSDGDTVTIGSKIYTLQTTLTDVDGNVLIGADLGDTVDNLVAALDLSGVAGTDYALTMTAQGYVTGVNTADDLVITAITPGIPSNSIATTETSALASWGADQMDGGLDGLYKLYPYDDTDFRVVFKEAARSILLEAEIDDAVKITASVGWAAADVPSAIKSAALLLIGDFYEFRSEKEIKLNRSSRNLLRPFKYFV